MGGFRLELKQTAMGVNSYHKNTIFVADYKYIYENYF